MERADLVLDRKEREEQGGSARKRGLLRQRHHNDVCMDIVEGYTCMSDSHLHPVGHDHEWMASTAQVTPNPVR